MKELTELKKQLESIDNNFSGKLTLKEYYNVQDLANSLSRLIKVKEFSEQIRKVKTIFDKCNTTNIDESTKATNELSNTEIKTEDIKHIAASQAGEELRKIFINTVSSFDIFNDESKRIAGIMAIDKAAKKQQKLKKQVRKILGYSKDEFKEVKISSFHIDESGDGFAYVKNVKDDYYEHYLYKKEIKKVKKYFDL